MLSPQSEDNKIIQQIKACTLSLRGIKVMLDSDLAALYQMKTSHLNERLKANRDKFSEKHFFQLTAEEKKEVVEQVDHLQKLKFSPNLPFAFSLYGILKLAFYVKSDIAREMSDYIIDAFADHILSKKNEHYQKVINKLNNHDKQLHILTDTLKSLMELYKEEEPSKSLPNPQRIGFTSNKED